MDVNNLYGRKTRERLHFLKMRFSLSACGGEVVKFIPDSSNLVLFTPEKFYESIR